MRSMNLIDVNQKILETAETLIQTKGYNAFSYRDIATIVGVKTSSIHYYYPTKADLGRAVVKMHVDILSDDLERVLRNSKTSFKKKLDLFFDGIIGKTYLSDRKMCLGGMLASDVLTLPEIIQDEVRFFFKKLEKWLAELLESGKNQREFDFKNSIKEEVQLILAVFEGALLLARLFKDEKRLDLVRKQVMERLVIA